MRVSGKGLKRVVVLSRILYAFLVSTLLDSDDLEHAMRESLLYTNIIPTRLELFFIYLASFACHLL